MHYNIGYAGLTPQLAHNQSIQDIKDYLGEEKYELLTKQFREECPDLSIEGFKMYVSLAGISGFPVRAWYNEVYPFG